MSSGIFPPLYDWSDMPKFLPLEKKEEKDEEPEEKENHELDSAS
jgi:hypothetical protein